jgi:DNA-binding NarL/FixJ family response regulator
MPMSVAVADNHEMTRWGVRSLVKSMKGTVVATAETGLDAVSMVEEHDPDLLTLSLKLPHLNGFDVLYHLQRRATEVDVLVLTTCRDEERVKSVFGMGASAYLLKQDPLEELCQAIKAVRAGQHYISDALPTSWMKEGVAGAVEHEDPCGALTLREREVMQLTAEGYTSEEIGAYLDISPRTAEKHRENIKEKLGIQTLIDMVRFAAERGFLPDSRVLRARATAKAGLG